MQMPHLEELNNDDDEDVQQNGTKSTEVERKLDAGNLLAEFLSSLPLQCLVKQVLFIGNLRSKEQSGKRDKETSYRILAC